MGGGGVVIVHLLSPRRRSRSRGGDGGGRAGAAAGSAPGSGSYEGLRRLCWKLRPRCGGEGDLRECNLLRLGVERER